MWACKGAWRGWKNSSPVGTARSQEGDNAVGEASIVLPPLQGMDLQLLWWVLASSGIALLYGLYLANKVISADPGNKSMQAVAQAIREGAMAYLKRQISVM